jgi:hypothetical protein
MKRLGLGGKVFVARLFLVREQLQLTGPMKNYNKKSWLRLTMYSALGTLRNGWEGILKWTAGEWQDCGWIHLLQDSHKRWDLVDTVMNLRIPYRLGIS